MSWLAEETQGKSRKSHIEKVKQLHLQIREHNVGQESKPRNSDFYQNNFLSMQEYQTHGAHSVKFS